jgi:hypothetical protein
MPQDRKPQWSEARTSQFQQTSRFDDLFKKLASQADTDSDDDGGVPLIHSDLGYDETEQADQQEQESGGDTESERSTDPLEETSALVDSSSGLAEGARDEGKHAYFLAVEQLSKESDIDVGDAKNDATHSAIGDLTSNTKTPETEPHDAPSGIQPKGKKQRRRGGKKAGVGSKSSSAPSEGVLRSRTRMEFDEPLTDAVWAEIESRLRARSVWASQRDMVQLSGSGGRDPDTIKQVVYWRKLQMTSYPELGLDDLKHLRELGNKWHDESVSREDWSELRAKAELTFGEGFLKHLRREEGHGLDSYHKRGCDALTSRTEAQSKCCAHPEGPIAKAVRAKYTASSS